MEENPTRRQVLEQIRQELEQLQRELEQIVEELAMMKDLKERVDKSDEELSDIAYEEYACLLCRHNRLEPDCESCIQAQNVPV